MNRLTLENAVLRQDGELTEFCIYVRQKNDGECRDCPFHLKNVGCKIDTHNPGEAQIIKAQRG